MVGGILAAGAGCRVAGVADHGIFCQVYEVFSHLFDNGLSGDKDLRGSFQVVYSDHAAHTCPQVQAGIRKYEADADRSCLGVDGPVDDGNIPGQRVEGMVGQQDGKQGIEVLLFVPLQYLVMGQLRFVDQEVDGHGVVAGDDDQGGRADGEDGGQLDLAESDGSVEVTGDDGVRKIGGGRLQGLLGCADFIIR